MRKTALIIGLASIAAPQLRAEETQYWAAWTFPEWQSGGFSTATALEQYHFDDGDFSFFYIGQKINYALNETWSIGAHPAVENWRRDGRWQQYYRLELEVTPTFQLSDKLSLSLRNRYELRREEGEMGDSADRYRPLATVTYQAAWLPRMTSYSASYEMFYSFDAERPIVHRYSPIRLTFKLNENISTAVYYLYQSKRQGLSNEWDGTHVLGLSSKLKF
ncbi:MAG: DUF2490 domain-containing protein [Verrucomicrobiota bacterium JB022]|nr:DUF2490 domain-containing protein [Verrucomicrobiota bacterium JB022]